METVRGKIGVTFRRGLAGGQVDNHRVIKRMVAHPQIQGVLIGDRLGFLIEESQCGLGSSPS